MALDRSGQPQGQDPLAFRFVPGGEPEDGEKENGVRARPMTVYDAVGGMPFFDELVEQFYRRVATDLLLRPLYPDDLHDSKRHLALFLAQYWGGPTTYFEERGHPRLRMRHAPFVIGEPERDAWMRHMSSALDAIVDDHQVHPVVEARLLDYLTSTADFLVNARTPG
jgi:hemoglobin